MEFQEHLIQGKFPCTCVVLTNICSRILTQRVVLADNFFGHIIPPATFFIPTSLRALPNTLHVLTRYHHDSHPFANRQLRQNHHRYGKVLDYSFLVSHHRSTRALCSLRISRWGKAFQNLYAVTVISDT